MKVKCFCCKIRIKTPQPATWTTHPSINPAHQRNGSAFHLCVENVWERSFNAITDTSSTMLIIATQRCNAKLGVTNNSKTLVSDVQQSQEKASVFCRRKIFTIRRLSSQMVQICFVDGEFRCFSCLDETLIISAKQVCDWSIDCFDGSDQFLCSNQSIAQALVGDQGWRCLSGQIHCNCCTECVAMDKVLCNFSGECKDQINQRFCRHEQRFSAFMRCATLEAKTLHLINVFATRCDNTLECWRMEDECESQCNPRPSFCDDEFGKMSCRGLYGNRVYDGYIDKVDSGLGTCSRKVEESCSMRFPCKSTKVKTWSASTYATTVTEYVTVMIILMKQAPIVWTNDSTAQQLEAPFPSAKSLFVMELKTATKVKMKVVNCAERKGFTAKMENQYLSIKSLLKMA